MIGKLVKSKVKTGKNLQIEYSDIPIYRGFHTYRLNLPSQ